MSDISPRLELPYIQPAQAQKHVTHNEALRVLDVLVQLTVVAFDATTPPSLPLEGEVHALGAGASGAWAGQDGTLAVYVDGVWQFHTPQAGWIATLAGTSAVRVWSGSAWEAASPDLLDNMTGLGVNTTSDSTNRLAVSAAATLFSHEGGDHRVKVNKASAGDTASLLFQSNWSGRGEIGLMGGDDFGFKVSPDGATFHEAIHIDRNTGRVTFPSGLGGTGSGAGPMGGQVVAISGAEASTFTVGQFMSMGDGGTTTAGAVMPFAGKVLAASMSIANGTAGVNVASIAVNKVENTGYQVSVTHAGGAVVSTGSGDFTGAPLAFAAGDALTMVANISSGASEVVTTVFVQYD
jgi:Protein of unknown function (DUF2793)